MSFGRGVCSDVTAEVPSGMHGDVPGQTYQQSPHTQVAKAYLIPIIAALPLKKISAQEETAPETPGGENRVINLDLVSADILGIPGCWQGVTRGCCVLL